MWIVLKVDGYKQNKSQSFPVIQIAFSDLCHRHYLRSKFIAIQKTGFIQTKWNIVHPESIYKLNQRKIMLRDNPINYWTHTVSSKPHIPVIKLTAPKSL